MKRILVTGGARRLGKEICIGLAAKGYSIVIHYRKSAEEAAAIVQECKRFGITADLIQGDFSTPELLADFIKRYKNTFPTTYAIINNVGNYLIKPASGTSPEEWNTLFQTNLHAPFALAYSLIPDLKKERGSIINIGLAGVGSNRAETYAAAYAITKNSLWMLTKSLAKELAHSHVRVNMVSPGYLDNSLDIPDPLTIPMGRLGRCNEVVRVITFLLEAENEYITGQNIEVAGGTRL